MGSARGVRAGPGNLSLQHRLRSATGEPGVGCAWPETFAIARCFLARHLCVFVDARESIRARQRQKCVKLGFQLWFHLTFADDFVIQGGSKEAKTCSACVSPHAFAAIPCCTRVGTCSMLCQCVSPPAIHGTPRTLVRASRASWKGTKYASVPAEQEKGRGHDIFVIPRDAA